MIYDVIIVGSGSVGAAAGYYATQSGLKVLMIDAHHPPHQQGSHHGSSRLIRFAYGEGEQYLPLLQRSKTLWQALEQISGQTLFHRSGVLNITPLHSDFMKKAQAGAAQRALQTEQLSAAQVRQRWPQIILSDQYQALYEKEAGYLACEQAVEQWIRLSREAGAAQLFNCPVSAIRDTGGIFQVATADGDYQATKLVITAGTWVKSLLPEIPVTPVRKVVAWFQSDGRFSENNHFPAFTAELTDGSQYYGFPSQKDELKVGRHDGGQEISLPSECLPFGQYPGDGSECFRFLREFLPGQGGCLYGQACCYDCSTDGDFIIDTLPQSDHLMIVTGLSGHGFKCAPALGEIASQFAAGQDLPDVVARFSLHRFS